MEVQVTIDISYKLYKPHSVRKGALPIPKQTLVFTCMPVKFVENSVVLERHENTYHISPNKCCWIYAKHRREAFILYPIWKAKRLSNCVCSTSLLKTLWENEKLLVTSNFSFSHSVF